MTAQPSCQTVPSPVAHQRLAGFLDEDARSEGAPLIVKTGQDVTRQMDRVSPRSDLESREAIELLRRDQPGRQNAAGENHADEDGRPLPRREDVHMSDDKSSRPSTWARGKPAER